MPFTNDVPATVVPDHPNPEFDNANELKGEYPEVPIDALRVHAAGLEPVAPVAPVADPPVGQTWAEQPYPPAVPQP